MIQLNLDSVIFHIKLWSLFSFQCLEILVAGRAPDITTFHLALVCLTWSHALSRPSDKVKRSSNVSVCRNIPLTITQYIYRIRLNSVIIFLIKFRKDDGVELNNSDPNTDVKFDPLTLVDTLYVMYVSMADTCFFGSSTVTKRSRVSPSRSSSNCRRFSREEEEAGLDVSTALPFGRLKSWNATRN